MTAGPTYEPIDPVRFIGNRSSGKMGYALAQVFANRGAKVFLVSGPVNLELDHPFVSTTKVETAAQMYEQCIHYFESCDGAVLAAAVADFTPASVAEKKIKKGNASSISLELKKTKDILKILGGKKSSSQFLVGFSLETDDEISNAKEKLKKKNCDIIVLNTLNDKGAGFSTDTNKITIINKEEEIFSFELKTKKEVAEDIVSYLEKYIKN